jgi:hypothetical protein
MGKRRIYSKIPRDSNEIIFEKTSQRISTVRKTITAFRTGSMFLPSRKEAISLMPRPH